MLLQRVIQLPKILVAAAMLLTIAMVSLTQGSEDPATAPREIAEDVTCGKCGMFPARYPQWQTQIIFADGTMTPFDGCKCMFDFLFNMDRFDKEHSSGDIAAVWVREFNTEDWIDARKAHYVIGSDKKGPMGKELIPFADAAAAESFQKEHSGEAAPYEAITMETLKPLMGKMHMKGKMDM
ncbi:MAG: nitrous oxide reductase accessory protein NosL [Desulfobulbaceae bacterium]|nr:nitrous oxide reductase accessory protein NosL [Desulfobulbaceae bacterium]